MNPHSFRAESVIEALIFHRMPADPTDDWFRLVGVVHLYSASGIHLLALLSWIETGTLAWGRRSGLRVETLQTLVWILFLGISMMVWKAEGFHFSLFRPLMTILLRRWLRLNGRLVGVFAPLFGVLILEALLTFRQGWSPGATHYYLAVGGACVALLRKTPDESKMRLHLQMAIYSWLPLAILDALHDRIAAPLTPLLSLITVPVVASFLYPLTLISFAWSGEAHPLLVRMWHLFLNGLIEGLDRVPCLFQLKGVGIASGALFALLFWKYRRDGRILTILPLAWALRLAIAPEAPHRVVQLDVGQGDSALIQKGGISELVDVGSARRSSPDRWIRTLARYGADGVSGVLLTHLDEDHSGGLRTLLASVRVGCIEMGGIFSQDQRGSRIRALIGADFRRTQILNSGCIRLSRIAWFESRRPGAKGNRWMAGLFHRLGPDRAYLALGDGDQEQEKEFLRIFAREIRRQDRRIWKVGHHGSKYSSGMDFLKKIQAQEAWISVGRNRYGHPTREVISRLQIARMRIRRTDHEGDLVSTE
jgi:beta-lactamase superfamily II metal-dependent hydrolase